MDAPEAKDVYVVATEPHFENNVNEATGKSGKDVIADYEAQYNEPPTTPLLIHAYDSTTLLLTAIEKVVVSRGQMLYINRARLREELSNTRGFQGLIGNISCDQFGDCGTGHAHIAQLTGSAVTDLAKLPIVYEYDP